MIPYITYAQLAADVTTLNARLPRDIVGVVGIPRSGMLPAAIFAQLRHIHLGCYPDFLNNGFWLGCGARLSGDAVPYRGKVLIIDDSASRGNALRQSREVWTGRTANLFEPIWAVVYKTGGLDLGGALHGVELPPRRYYEWNLLQHPGAGDFMLDIDGVLNLDLLAPDNDGELYAAALRNAVPLHLPHVKIGALVTCRLERWRAETEAWLSRAGVRYGKLVMHPAKTAEERRWAGNCGYWKGSVYRKHPATVFVESSAHQAPAIAAASGKPVICLEDGRSY